MSCHKLIHIIFLFSILLLSACSGNIFVPSPTTPSNNSPFGNLLEGQSDQPPLESVFAPLLNSNKKEDRTELQNDILKRAQEWVDEGVPYSININPQRGYRTDCSGFVSFAWGLQPGPNGGLNTATLQSPSQSIAFISIEDLQPGDILDANNNNTKHAVIFGGWIDQSKYTFIAYEENYGLGKAVSRKLRIEPREEGLYLPDEQEIKGQTQGEGPYLIYRLISSDILGASSGSSIATPNVSANKPSSEGWIAFVNKNNVWLIHPDGSGLKQVTNNSPTTNNDVNNNDIKIKWSHDGQKLAFSQSNRLYVIDIATFTSKLLVDDTAGGFDWSLTSKQIIYDDVEKQGNKPFDYSNNGFWVINVDNGNKQHIIKTSNDVSAILDPQWSPEGSHVIFSGPGAFEAGGSYVTEIGTSNFTTIFAGGNAAAMDSCNWSTRELIISCIKQDEHHENNLEIFLLDGNGNSIREILLPEGLGFPSVGPWSPDGKKLSIGYISGTLDDNNLHDMTYILSLDTGEFQSIGPGRASDWSPDEQWIVTWNESYSGDHNPFIMMIVNTSSGQSFPLIEGMLPVWQPTKH